MKWHSFTSAQLQAENLASQVGLDLISLLQQKDIVTLCIPGGTTPALFLDLLSKISLDWSRVQVVLNDERCVPLNDSLSNEAMVRKVLLRNEAIDAQIVSLFDSDLDLEQVVEKFNQSISNVLPLDVCILGMGDDGHTASLFPTMVDLIDALNLDKVGSLIPVHVPQKAEQRVSFNLSALLSAERHYVLIKGKEKQEVIKEAGQALSMNLPISHLLARAVTNVYYTD